MAEHVNVPIAAGERFYMKYGFREVLELQAADIIQPDPCHADGILECKKIAAMAETYHVKVAPHNPASPVCLAVCVQLDACMPNFLIQEMVWKDVSWRDKILKEPIKVEGGYIRLPTKPGIGIELDEKIIEEHPYRPYEQPRIYCKNGMVEN